MSAQADAFTRLILVSSETHNPALRRRLTRTASSLAIADAGSSAMDAGQLGLDAAGLIPGAGEIFDGINALVSLIRGDYMGAALSVISMVPLAGDAVGKGGKIALWLAKLSKKEGKLGKLGQYIVKNAPTIKKSLAQFSKFLVENRRQILVALRTVTSLVKTVSDPSQAEKGESSAVSSAAKLIAKSRKLKGITEKAEPHLSQMSGAVLNLLQLAQASDDMFMKLEERAQAEAGGVA